MAQWRLSARGVGVVLTTALFVAGATLAAQPAKGPKKTFRSLSPGNRRQPPRPVRARSGPGRTLGVGTIQYDNDIPFSRDGLGFGVGNRFNAGFQNPHSVASVSFRRGGAANTTAQVAIVPVPLTTVLGSGILSGLPPSTVGSMVWVLPLQNPVVGHSGSFLAGLLNAYTGACAGNTMLGAPCDGVALTAGTMDPGMGFHAVRIYPVPGTTGVDIPNRNAIFRVTGDNLPVELMGLSVE
jgi:hypothetical protein